jgi:hypothetical protein
VAALCVVIGLAATGQAHAQLSASTGTVIEVLTGWNLLSFGGATEYLAPLPANLDAPLYTLQPDETTYRMTDIQHLTPGQAYWAHFSAHQELLEMPSAALTFTTALAAGQCATLGNPSTRGSARVVGADAVYVFSPALNSYIQESLVPIGRGAFVCNSSAAPEVVTIGDQGDVVAFATADLPNPTPYDGNGRAQIVLKNDTNYPIVGASRQIQADGTFVTRSNGFNFAGGIVRACDACSEYASGTHACSTGATFATILVDAGMHQFHVQVEGRNIPDFLGTVTLQPNLSYTLCIQVYADRPTGELP